jgi:hypothetical protein
MFSCLFQQALKKNRGGGCGRLDGVSEDTEFELWDSRFMLRGDHEPEIGYKQARYALAIYSEGLNSSGRISVLHELTNPILHICKVICALYFILVEIPSSSHNRIFVVEAGKNIPRYYIYKLTFIMV